MYKNIFLSAMLYGLCLTSFTASANDKVQSTYDVQKYQQVCKGKTQGDQVSFAYRGIIWNGTCQPQFFSSSKTKLLGTEAELNSVCHSDAKAKSITVDGKEVKGKCALGFAPPSPR
ncbi:hypothetical protein D9K80_11025 [Acinetobacter cumulans]|uniref:DUF3617 family protein n=1 Tax=Acinetobacter cumulans TaxID=2136182 RepID=A0A498D342_9GAMM|nr:hypothetical protein [Acinetobacter cumulans]RLL34572.1 hypothetical protein D9K80_11025 [Acinetobacter cumulans]